MRDGAARGEQRRRAPPVSVGERPLWRRLLWPCQRQLHDRRPRRLRTEQERLCDGRLVRRLPGALPRLRPADRCVPVVRRRVRPPRRRMHLAAGGSLPGGPRGYLSRVRHWRAPSRVVEGPLSRHRLHHSALLARPGRRVLPLRRHGRVLPRHDSSHLPEHLRRRVGFERGCCRLCRGAAHRRLCGVPQHRPPLSLAAPRPAARRATMGSSSTQLAVSSRSPPVWRAPTPVPAMP